MKMPHYARTSKGPRRRSAEAKRIQIRRVQRSERGDGRGGGVVSNSMRGLGAAETSGEPEVAGNSAICTGVTIWAALSVTAGAGAFFSQQGDLDGAGEWCEVPVCREWLIMAQWAAQLAFAGEALGAQMARSITGAMSTAISNTAEMDRLARMCHLYNVTRVELVTKITKS